MPGVAGLWNGMGWLKLDSSVGEVAAALFMTGGRDYDRLDKVRCC